MGNTGNLVTVTEGGIPALHTPLVVATQLTKPLRTCCGKKAGSGARYSATTKIRTEAAPAGPVVTKYSTYNIQIHHKIKRDPAATDRW